MEVVERAAEDAYVVGVSEVGYQGGLGGLVFEVAAEVCAAEAPSQVLLFSTEIMLGFVVGSFYDGDDRAVLISDHWVAEEVVTVPQEVAQGNGVGACGFDEALVTDPFSQVLDISVGGFFDFLSSLFFQGGEVILPGKPRVASWELAFIETQDISRLAEGKPSFLQPRGGVIEALVFW